MEFGELIDALLAERIDMIAAGMFITPDRQQRVLFSVPTLLVKPGLLVGQGNPKAIVSCKQAAEANVRIAVLQGAVEGEILQRRGVPVSRLIEVPDALTGRKAVEHGLADALMLSEPTLRWMAKQDQLGRTELLLLSEFPPEDELYGHPAFAFRPNAQQLLRAWNAALTPFLHSPEHQALLVRFGLEATGIETQP